MDQLFSLADAYDATIESLHPNIGAVLTATTVDEQERDKNEDNSEVVWGVRSLCCSSEHDSFAL